MARDRVRLRVKYRVSTWLWFELILGFNVRFMLVVFSFTVRYGLS